MKNWLLENGYIYKDGFYINYNAGIIVEPINNDKPFVKSLHGFYTDEYIKLSIAMAEYYPII